MAKIRSLNQQMRYAMEQHRAIGISKHNSTMADRIHSLTRHVNLKDTTKQFTNYMKVAHPEVRMAKDITAAHVQEWVNAKAPNWSNETIKNKISDMQVLSRQLNATYHSNHHWKIEAPYKEGAHNIRDKAMTTNDLQLLRDAMKHSHSSGKIAMEVTARCGLRVREVSHLHADRINIEKKVIEVRAGAKGGKMRDVPIRDKDLTFFRQLKEQSEGGYVTRGCKEGSLNAGIRRAMKECGIATKYERTTEHAIRKMYATERFVEEKAKGLTDKQAWCKVQEELGHGSKFRHELFRTYIKQ